MATLLVSREGSRAIERNVGLDGSKWIIGRGPAADIRLDDDTVSREHVELTREAGAFWVHDLGSTNGTYVNGLLVRRRAVIAGDAITVGHHTLRLAQPSTRISTLPRWDVSERATVRCHNRVAASVERELELARQIQHRLVPDSARFPQLEVAVGFEPCSWVGGDYADTLPLADGRVLIAVADVCGKGLQAALVASSLHTLVHASADRAEGLCETATRMNRYLMRFLPPHSFVTLGAMIIDPASGMFEHLNAGHLPALMLSASGGAAPLAAGRNVPLGVIESSFEIQRGLLALGDAILLYTDGISESDDMSHGRLARLAAGVMTSHRGGSATDLREALARALAPCRGAEVDDRTFLVAKRSASLPEPAAIGDASERHVA